MSEERTRKIARTILSLEGKDIQGRAEAILLSWCATVARDAWTQGYERAREDAAAYIQEQWWPDVEGIRALQPREGR